MPFRIREVNTSNEDLRHELYVLHQLTFDRSAPQPDYAEGRWWLVKGEGSYVAFAGLTPSYWEHTGYFKRVGVLPHARGNNLQVRLLRVAASCAKRLGYTGIVSDTTDNPPSANAMIRGGYQIFDPPQRWAFAHSIYWKKAIS